MHVKSVSLLETRWIKAKQFGEEKTWIFVDSFSISCSVFAICWGSPHHNCRAPPGPFRRHCTWTVPGDSWQNGIEKHDDTYKSATLIGKSMALRNMMTPYDSCKQHWSLGTRVLGLLFEGALYEIRGVKWWMIDILKYYVYSIVKPCKLLKN